MTVTTSLQAQLDALKAQLTQLLPPEALAAIGDDTAALIRSQLVVGVLNKGAPAPDFALPDTLGATVRLAGLLTRGPVVLVFYRGEWCPYCNLALRAYQACLPEIERLGATLVAISPQTPDNSLTTVEKKGLTFPVLSDAGNRVARQYGLVFALGEAARPVYAAIGADLPAFNGDTSWELPMPGVFVIARDGTVRLAAVEADFTQRPEPDAILGALRDLADGAQ
jgi:peroxiredoxin